MEEKIKLLDANKTRQSCRQLANQFCTGKTTAAKTIKNEASIRHEHERFKGNLTRNRKGQFHKINEILTHVSKSVARHPDGQMLEEAFEIKKTLEQR